MALSVADMIKGERPKSSMRAASLRSGSSSLRRKRNSDFLRKKNEVTHTAETACESTVASAAPRCEKAALFGRQTAQRRPVAFPREKK